jgi:hypothetical protein
MNHLYGSRVIQFLYGDEFMRAVLRREHILLLEQQVSEYFRVSVSQKYALITIKKIVQDYRVISIKSLSHLIAECFDELVLKK